MWLFVILFTLIGTIWYLFKMMKQAKYDSNKPNLSKKQTLNVVITGATKGLGFALAKRFLQSGDRVVICSRSQQSVDTALNELEKFGPNRVFGVTCDISNIDDMYNLAKFAREKLGDIDLWINNAGYSGYGRTLLEDMEAEKIKQVVTTNTLGTLYSAKVAIKTLKEQPNGGQIYTYFEGAGSNGWATPYIAAYGTTKYGLAQLNKSLVEETKDTKVGIHRLQPGMIMTEMLHTSAGGNPKAYKVFNILAETADVVADFLVPRLRKTKGTGRCITFMTTVKAIFRFMTAFMRKNRFYDDKGQLKIKLA
jgi:short-subunit dehydrogenase